MDNGSGIVRLPVRSKHVSCHVVLIETKTVLVFVVAEGRRHLVIFINLIDFENDSFIPRHNLPMVIDEVASPVYTVTVHIFQSWLSPNIFAIAYNNVISFLIYVKVTYDFIYFELGDLVHTCRAKLLPFFSLLESFKIIQNIVGDFLAEETVLFINEIFSFILFYHALNNPFLSSRLLALIGDHIVINS